jgi:hypothetical protein
MTLNSGSWHIVEHIGTVRLIVPKSDTKEAGQLNQLENLFWDAVEAHREDWNGNEKTALARQSTPGLRFMCILIPWMTSLSVFWPS